MKGRTPLTHRIRAKIHKEIESMNGKKLLIVLGVLFGITTVSVLAVGMPETFSGVPRVGNYKQCDCSCNCAYCLSGECTFKRGT